MDETWSQAHESLGVTKEEDGTYTPITDSFLGGMLLMIARDDRRSKELRGDVLTEEKDGNSRMDLSRRKNLYAEERVQEDRPT